MTRIGFDISQSGSGRAGCGYVAWNLLLELARSSDGRRLLAYPTWGNRFWDPHWREIILPNVPAEIEIGMSHESLAEAMAFWHSPPGDLENRLGDVSVVHSNNFFCPPPAPGRRIVYTLYDLSFIANPEWTTEYNRVICFEGVFGAATSADLILAISNYSRAHFLEVFPFYPADRVVVIPLGSRFLDCSQAARPNRFAQLARRGFWLSVGTIEPRKNLTTLLKAYRRLKATSGDMKPLVIAGQQGWLMPDFEKTIAALGLTGDVMLVGYVDDPELQWLLENALALIYPSLFEGFGLPPLEAMSVGTPVICSNTTSMPEVVGDAGITTDPKDFEGLANAMAMLERDEELAARLGALGRARARRFTWKAAARALNDAYAMVTGEESLRHAGAGRNDLAQHT